MTVDGLKAGEEYDYTILVNGDPVAKGTLRTYPAKGSPGKFNVAFGGGAGYVPEWERMWDVIREKEPAALLMLGDNVYIDQPEFRLCHDYCYYRRQARPEWRRLVGSTPVYAIYDDHDFGKNDCVPGPEIELPPWKPANYAPSWSMWMREHRLKSQMRSWPKSPKTPTRIIRFVSFAKEFPA